jgi:hypothetical protein
MLFDDNWLIYYKNNGFTDLAPYHFSMNMVDAGLYRYIQGTPAARAMNIPSSFYTIEAPFSAEATRGPSLNYLMMGLLRGSMSEVFGKTALPPPQLYDGLCGLYATITDDDDEVVDQFITQLLPIYSIPVSSHALPLFKHIAKAPLFACHMLYDLQHRISALPSRIKWAGDREQYMVLKGYSHGVFVTLDTTGYFCALANGVTSLLERKGSIKLVSATITPEEWKIVQAKAAKAQQKRKASEASSSSSSSAADDEENEDVQPAAASGKKVTNPKKTAKKGGANPMGGMTSTHTRKNTLHQAITILDRDYFFLGWLYPLVMAVNEACHDRHPAEEAYTLLQKLSDHIRHPGLFPILQGQFLHAVSRIPHASKDLMASVKELTAETYESNAPHCVSLLKEHYTAPSSIFSNPVHKRTLLGYLIEMKQALSARYSSKDSTMDLLHTLLTQEDQEKACLVLALLFERLHGRIQSGTSYLGQILGITGGPVLERVDDQEAWEYLTTVMEEDMARMAVSANASDKTAAEPANVAALPALATPPNTRRISAKLRHVKRGPAFRKMNNAFTQLRSNRASHALRPSHTPRADVGVSRVSRASRVSRVPMTQNARRLVMGGSRKKTRRAKERRAKRDSRQSRRKE